MPSFKWKDREGAMHQAAYQYRLSREYVENMIREMTPKQIEEEKKFFGPGYEPKLNVEGTLQSCLEVVLGTGSKFQNYYCVNPENMSSRQYTQFKNDVRNEIRHRDEVDELIKSMKDRKEKQQVSCGGV